MWVHQSRHLKLSLTRRIIIFILGFLDNILFGGAIFGWPQLVYVLKVENIYADLCDENEALSAITNSTEEPYEGKIIMGMDFSNVTRCLEINNSSSISIGPSIVQHEQQCVAQDKRFALVYTVALICYGIPGVVVGYLLHHAGLRIVRMLGMMMVTASFICFALTTAESPNWLFPATILLSMGGNQARMSGMQFGDLFPKYRSTTITVLTGVYAASASLFLLFSIAQENNVSRILICYIIGGFAFVSSLLSILMPIHHIPYDGEHLEEEECTKLKHKKIETFNAPLWNSLKTLSSVLHLYWFFFLLFCINIYQQFYNVWITASTCNTLEAGFYSKMFSYSTIASVFCAPIGGLFTDYLIKKAQKNSKDQVHFMVKEIQANFLSLFITTLFSLTMPICMLFFNPVAIIISLLSMIVVRPCVIAISTAYIRIRFPGDHFNRLLGIYCTIASALMYFQYPVFLWAQHAYYQAMGLVVLLNVFTLLNPLHLLCTSHIRKSVLLRDGSSHEDKKTRINGT